MLDITGILSDYLPLQVISFGDVYGEESDYESWLNEYDFSWSPKVGGRHKPQLYFGDEELVFETEGKNKQEALQAKLNGQLLRLPKISYCWGNQSIMVANELADQLSFSPILGVTRTKATVIDAAGQTRDDFTAFSFHKSFFHERTNTRFEKIETTLRPIININLKKSSTVLLVHKSVLEAWQQIGIEDVLYDISEEHLSLKKLINNDMYFSHAGSRCYRTLNDFQENVKPMCDFYN